MEEININFNLDYTTFSKLKFKDNLLKNIINILFVIVLFSLVFAFVFVEFLDLREDHFYYYLFLSLIGVVYVLFCVHIFLTRRYTPKKPLFININNWYYDQNIIIKNGEVDATLQFDGDNKKINFKIKKIKKYEEGFVIYKTLTYKLYIPNYALNEYDRKYLLSIK